jgi:hypothetical protein
MGLFRMPLLSLPGETGKHNDDSGRECGGRNFDVYFSPSASATGAKQVGCTVCGREFTAWENGLGPEPAYPSTRST